MFFTTTQLTGAQVGRIKVALIPDTSKKSKLLILSQETRMRAVEKLKAQEMLVMKDSGSLQPKLADVNFYP